MPSPFPGMDPYIERADLWPGAHNELVYCIGAALNRALPSPYVARTEARCYVEYPSLSFIPDVTVSQRNPDSTKRAATTDRSETFSASQHYLLPMEERNESFIEVVTTDMGQVVTLLEVLSHTNKRPGDRGRNEYLRKQQQVLYSETNLLEIDLLRSGEHTVAMPEDRIERQSFDYVVSLFRASTPPELEVWANSVREPLPRVKVPLREGDEDVLLDLQEVFTRMYDEGAYAKKVDYTAQPVPPLRDEDRTWAIKLLSSSN